MKKYISLLLLLFVFLNLNAQNQQVLDEALKLKNSLDSYMKEQIGNTPLTDKEKWMFSQIDSLRKQNLKLMQNMKDLDTIHMKKIVSTKSENVHSLTLSIFFESNSAALDNKSKLYLSNIVKSLKSIMITLQAFTDAYGTPDYNSQLADARLKNLIDYLRAEGFNGEIKTMDYTYDSKASGQNSSFNRRIDILL
jgi:outer membrane protein OmpA-like peptidoglycan-associated protein